MKVYGHIRKVWLFFIDKFEVFPHVKNFKCMVEKETGLKIMHMRSNVGGEDSSYVFSSYSLQKNGNQR